MATQTTYLITGANRGIGRGYVQAFLSRPATTVIAAVRDPSHQFSQRLKDLPKGDNSKLILVKIDSPSQTDALEAVADLHKVHNIDALDVVIANAGISVGGTTIRKTTAANIQHFNINSVAPVLLFQATADLLKVSKSGNPKFIAISTLIGSIAYIGDLVALGFPSTANPYGGSKTALNWFIRCLHFEEPWLTSFVFHPGLVETDLAAGAVAGTGFELKDLGAISVEHSVTGMIKIIDKATTDYSGM
jgi:norsolorinic acid ketoreductase